MLKAAHSSDVRFTPKAGLLPKAAQAGLGLGPAPRFQLCILCEVIRRFMSTPRGFVMLAVISIATTQTIISEAHAAAFARRVGQESVSSRRTTPIGPPATVDLGFPVDSGPPGRSTSCLERFNIC
jgi:hypothetical protein